MYSLVITTYNRVEFVIQSFIQVLHNELISEIIIVDDHSDKPYYENLKLLISFLNNDKIKLFRNEKNLGPLKNKYEAVKKASNEYCIMLDSDNVIDNTYVDIVSKLKKEPDMLYCPETLYKADKVKVNFSYTNFIGLVIDKSNAKKYIKDKFFECWLNTGNYFFNRQQYVDVIEGNMISSELTTSDSVYFSYLWLLSGNRTMIVPGLNYIHVVHGGSWYKTHLKKCNDATVAVKGMIEVMR